MAVTFYVFMIDQRHEIPSRINAWEVYKNIDTDCMSLRTAKWTLNKIFFLFFNAFSAALQDLSV